MIKKLKNNLKAINKKESSLLDFVKDINENIKLKGIQLISIQERRKFNRDKEKSLLNLTDSQFNEHIQIRESSQRRRIFAEDKENITRRNKTLALSTLSSLNYSNKTIKNYFEPIQNTIKNYPPMGKIKKIEFYDELNKKNVKMIQFEENDLEFTKSKILPKVKFMKVDNDVMTDDEQLKDAFNMMRNNLKECIKSIQDNKDFLSKNLSRKIKFSSVSKCK